MRTTHSEPASIRAANLARWFPLWTVSRENWNTVLGSSVSGVATDTLLFSRIGVPLVHRYRVFARSGTHGAFRGTYMARLRTFLTVADAAYLMSRDKRRGQSLASQMSPASASVVVVTPESSTPAVVRPHRYGSWAASFPLDLSLPRFAALELQTGPCQTRWVHEYDPPASIRGSGSETIW